jgi:N-acetylglucosaminyldiphosphoundecaprenol N-acetyl-beta-D-mannosaminyltransferase
MTEKQKLFGIEIDALPMRGAIQRLRDWIEVDRTDCKYVVTPNVDHTVLLSENRDFLAAYRDADLILADGHPIVWASRLLGRPLPERVPGSELVPELFSAYTGNGRLRSFLLGAAEGVSARAASNIHRRWPNVEIVGVYSPPLGFEKCKLETEEILGRLALCRPDLLVVGLGAPKQEIWVHKNRRFIAAKVALCAGATIDFLAGEKTRAPIWMQKSGMEWLHRMLSEPKRLALRYAKDAWMFPQIVGRQAISQLR